MIINREAELYEFFKNELILSSKTSGKELTDEEAEILREKAEITKDYLSDDR